MDYYDTHGNIEAHMVVVKWEKNLLLPCLPQHNSKCWQGCKTAEAVHPVLSSGSRGGGGGGLLGFGRHLPPPN